MLDVPERQVNLIRKTRGKENYPQRNRSGLNAESVMLKNVRGNLKMQKVKAPKLGWELMARQNGGQKRTGTNLDQMERQLKVSNTNHQQHHLETRKCFRTGAVVHPGEERVADVCAGKQFALG